MVTKLGKHEISSTCMFTYIFFIFLDINRRIDCSRGDIDVYGLFSRSNNGIEHCTFTNARNDEPDVVTQISKTDS